MNSNTHTQAFIKLGLSPDRATAQADMVRDALSRLAAHGWSQPAGILMAPGRIEFLGKHTDYCGGRSIVCATQQGLCLLVTPRSDTLVRVLLLDSGELAEFDLSKPLSPVMGHWSNYIMTAARRVVANFGPDVRGMDLAIASNLPPASGMSSSSALVTGAFLALAKCNRLSEHPNWSVLPTTEELAAYLGTVENGQSYSTLVGDAGVGTFGGSEDHAAILCSKAGYLRQFSFSPLHGEQQVALGDQWTLVVGVSGVIAEKTGAARDRYNACSLAIREALKIWQEAGHAAPASLAKLAHSEGGLEPLKALLATHPRRAFGQLDLLERVTQFEIESEHIIPEAMESMARQDWRELGKLADLSQHNTETLLRNQVPETIFLAAEARRLGAAAASAFGAGFGGSVWAMVDTQSAAAFAKKWQARYSEAFPAVAANSNFICTTPGPGAFWLKDISQA